MSDHATAQNAQPARPSSVPVGTVAYAVGDIHGRADLLRQLLERIAADAALRPAHRRVVIFLGDYTGRGPDSRTVLDILSTDGLDGFETIALKGNQEDVVLRYLDGDLSWGRKWFGRGGGLAVLRSYGINAPSQTEWSLDDLADLRRRLIEALSGPHLDFLRGLRPCHREGDYLFVHAGLRLGVPLDRQTPEDMIWGGLDPERIIGGMSDRDIEACRQAFIDSPDDFGAVIVYGHIILPAVDMAKNRIGIDTGAYRTGVLSCLVLDGTSRQIIQAIGSGASDERAAAATRAAE